MQASRNAAQPPARSGNERGPEIQPVELDEFRHTAQAQRLAQLENDTALLLGLSVSGFVGPTWERAATEFVRYGHTVIRAWLRGGLIWSKCRDKHLAVEPRRDLRYADVDDLAQNTVAEAIVSFQRALQASRWDPTKGASLTTFFIGNCLMQFTNQYRAWVRQSRHALVHGYAQPDPHDLRTPERLVVTDAEIAELLDSIPDPTTRSIVVFRVEGYSHIEIAELLGCTVKSVESRLHRLKNRRPQITTRKETA